MGQPFIAYDPRPEDYWRGIIMFGRNVATYKFALGRALLDLRPAAGQLVTLEELAAPFAAHLCKHLRTAEKQGASRQSRFLDACRQANAGKLDQDELVATTLRLGFQNVIEGFHVIGRDEVPRRFFVDERTTGAGIRETDAFSSLVEGEQIVYLPSEAEARWRLVKTAWELGVSRALVTVGHDPESATFFAVDANRRRRPITGARAALSGYQKGHCFYCFEQFSLLAAEPPDVDHFFPHSLKSAGAGESIDGVCNLVLACRRCNRGVSGKSNRVPSLRLLERLSTRNEFLIASQHPLRETLIAQTGASETERRRFLNAHHAGLNRSSSTNGSQLRSRSRSSRNR